ncbi:MAG: FAD-binding protein [Dehalococcoidia bacterium]|nr:FAD-binding protein [Dehalococcoidia bacterium]
MSAATLKELGAILGKDCLLTAPEDVAAYAYDATPLAGEASAVALPRSADQAAAVLRVCNREGVPVVPRGAGTNLSGGTIPQRGMLVMAMTRMDRIIEIDVDNLTATAQPGIVLGKFKAAIEAKGLLYPPDPSSMQVASFGGTVAESAGGLSGVKYGTTRDYVIGLEAALANGDLIRVGGKTLKNVSGYDLTHLFVGSEGTLGVITEATVRLIPLPEARRTALAVFNLLEDAAEAVSEIIRRKVVPRSLELIDSESIKHIEAYKPAGLPLDAEAVLLIEVDGRASHVDEDLALAAAACRDMRAREVRIATNAREAEALWAARRSHYPALARACPTIIIEDVCVPRHHLPRMVKMVKEASRRHGLKIGMVAHAGEGNLHPDILCDARNAEEMRRVEQFIEEIVREALSLGGTLTGEHGIGSMKAPFLAWQFGAAGVETMKRIKATLDPKGILNPDKLFSEGGMKLSRSCG